MAILNQEAYEELKQLLSASVFWKELATSQFVEHLAIFLGLATEDADFKVERARQEAFLSTALNRSSITSFVEDREYLPRKPKPSIGTVTITNLGTSRVTMLKGREFLSETQLSYSLDATTIIDAGQSVDASMTQIKKTVVEHTVSEAKAFYEILLDRELTQKVVSIKVSMDRGAGFEEWTYSRLLTNAFATSKVWDEFYSFKDQLGIRFGNGVFGLIPPAGASVKIEVQETDGATLLMSRQLLYPVNEVSDENGAAAILEVVVSENIAGGDSPEGTEEIRRNLHYWPVYNERLVWANDYVYFLRRRFPEIIFAKAWGEETSEAMWGYSTAHINKIFVCAYAPRAGLQADCMAALADVPMLNRNFQWYEPEHVTFRVAMSGKVMADRAIDDVVRDVKASLTAYYGRDSSARRSTVLLSEIYEAIYSTGHFTAGTGAYFEAHTSGTVAPDKVYQMTSINLAASTFDISYL